MKLGAVVLDSDNSEELSEFYSNLLGWSKEVQLYEGDKWITVSGGTGEVPLILQPANKLSS